MSEPAPGGSDSPVPGKPLSPRVIALVAGAGTLAVLASAAVVGARRLGDFDLPWHMAFGRVVAMQHHVPDVDPLAYTSRPIEHAEFAADLLLYGLERLGGPLALQALGGVALVATALLLALHPQRPRPGWLGWPMIALAVAAASPWFVVRPALLSFVLLAALLLLIGRHRSSRSRAALSAAAPLMAAWANLHGFVVVGVAVLGIYLVHCAACRLARDRAGALLPAGDGHDLAATAVIVLASLAASTLNVAGIRLWLGPMRAAADTSRVTEWARPDLAFLTRVEPACFVFFVAVAVALAVGREPARPEAEPSVPAGSRLPSAFELGLVLLAAVLAASAVRLIAVAAVLLAPVAARRSGVLLERAFAGVAQRASWLAVATGVTPLLLPLWLGFRSAPQLGAGFDLRNQPEGAVRWIERAEPQGRMYNFLPYGGWLSWRLWPRHRVLVDGRSGWVHDPELLARVYASDTDVGAFSSLAHDFGIEWAVARAIEGELHDAGVAADRAFTMVYFDEVSAVYVRAAGPNAPLAAHGYRVLRHLTDLAQVLEVARRGARAADLAHDGALAMEQDPESPRAAFLGACGALAIRDRNAFDQALLALERLAPGHPSRSALEAAWR